MTPEGKVVALIRARVKEANGEVRKCSWEGVRGAPDLLVLLPGVHAWIEAKARSGLIRFASMNGCRRQDARSSSCTVKLRPNPW